MRWSRLLCCARTLVAAVITVSAALLHEQESRAQETAQRPPQQIGQIALPPINIKANRRAKQSSGKRQVAQQPPAIEAPPKVESATGPVQGYVASRSATGI